MHPCIDHHSPVVQSPTHIFSTPLQALYQKQGRSSQFSSRSERDAHVEAEVRALQEAKAKQAASQEALEKQLRDLNGQLMDVAQVGIVFGLVGSAYMLD